jgi:phosphotransacetylase
MTMDNQHHKYQRLLDFCKSLPPTPTAVAHPCDESSLRGAVEAAELGLIAPILVGPRARIEALAKELGIDLKSLPIVDAPYSEASAAKAVELVREGKALQRQIEQPDAPMGRGHRKLEALLDDVDRTLEQLGPTPRPRS